MNIAYKSGLFSESSAESSVESDLFDRTSGVVGFVASIRANPSPEATLTAARVFREVAYTDYEHDCYIKALAAGSLPTDDLQRLIQIWCESTKTLPSYHDLKTFAGYEIGREDFVLTASFILIECGQGRQASRLLLRERFPDSRAPAYHLQLSAALESHGKRLFAMRLLHRLIRNQGSGWEARVRCANVAISLKRYDVAIDCIDCQLKNRPLFAANLLITAYLEIGERVQAHNILSEYLDAYPTNIELRRRRAELASTMGLHSAAADDFIACIDSDCTDLTLKRCLFSNLTEAGRHGEALKVGAELLGAFPDDATLADAMTIVIERNLNRARVAEARMHFRQANTIRPMLRKPVDAGGSRWKLAARNQVRVLGALMVRESLTMFGKSRFGYFWMLFQPLAHVSIMVTLISIFSMGRRPPSGESFASFYLTGVVPYMLFTHTVNHVMKAPAENRPVLQLPPVKLLDVFIARALLEFVAALAVGVTLVLVLHELANGDYPSDLLGVITPLILVWIFGFGVGMCCSVISLHSPGWERIWGAVASLLYFSSGTFYTAKMMSPEVRDVLSWNPVLQAIELLRASYFNNAGEPWFSLLYLTSCALGFALLGLFLVRLNKRKLLDIE